MNKRRLGALVGAAVLMLAAVGAVSATAPVPHVTVTKTADNTVPASGGDVAFTITVHNDSGCSGGACDFKTVIVNDTNVGCDLSDPAGTGAPDTLADGDTWTYTCTITGMHAGDTNHVDVLACKDNSVENCNNDKHDATGSADATVQLTAATPTPGATQAPTDSVLAGSGTSSDSVWFLVLALGVLLGSLVVLRPSAAKRGR